jgi:uncharacterized protein YyaL (SSP411 family)
LRPAAALLLALVIAAAAFDAGRGAADPSPPRADGAQAAQSYKALRQAYAVDSGLLTDAGRRYAHAWPVSQALAASLAAASIPGEVEEARDDVQRIIAGLQHYHHGDAYDATIRPPFGRGAAQFYDDNEWIALDLVAAYHLLDKQPLLSDAERIFEFVTRGWDRNRRHACPGGVFWVDSPRNRARNTVSTANGALLALDLYGVTHRRRYVTWARRMYAWVNRCLQARDGLLYDHLDLRGRVTTDKWTYNQGAMIAVAVGLAQATGDTRYLDRAERLARAALAHYRRIDYSGEPVVFVAIFYRDLRLLEKARSFALAERERLAYVRRHVRLDAGGRFGQSLIDQAGAAQLYAQALLGVG